MVEFFPVTKKDLAAVMEIYNYYILNSTATFHSEKMSHNELEEFLFVSHPKYPSFVMKDHDEITMYCFLTRYKKRQAYDRSAELSVYLKPAFTGKGIGPGALNYLEAAFKKGRYSCACGHPVRKKPCKHPADGKVRLFPMCPPEKYRGKIRKTSGCCCLSKRDITADLRKSVQPVMDRPLGLPDEFKVS
jgi:hypothetical protein